MEYFNLKTGKFKTKYKTTANIDKIWLTSLYLYTARVLKKLLTLTHEQEYAFGTVKVTRVHPTIEKLYKLYSFWMNYRHVAQLDYHVILQIPLKQDEVVLFDHITHLVNILSTHDYTFLKRCFNISVAEILLHPGDDDLELASLPSKWTNENKLYFIYSQPLELLEPIDTLCEACIHTPIPSLSLERNL